MACLLEDFDRSFALELVINTKSAFRVLPNGLDPHKLPPSPLLSPVGQHDLDVGGGTCPPIGLHVHASSIRPSTKSTPTASRPSSPNTAAACSPAVAASRSWKVPRNSIALWWWNSTPSSRGSRASNHPSMKKPRRSVAMARGKSRLSWCRAAMRQKYDARVDWPFALPA